MQIIVIYCNICNVRYDFRSFVIMKLSVIIPTYNRADVLEVCLAKLLKQKGIDFEVIVVDDGSTDNTEDVVKGFINTEGAQSIAHLQYVKQPKSHQGTARNRGVKKAKGDIIIFIGDDIFVQPDFLKKHHDRHTENPDQNVVVLGFTTWDTQLKINDYMIFLEDSGWQFGYKFLLPKWINKRAPYKFFYTSNISLKKKFFNKEKFDEQFKVYGWEDIELGYRLWKNHNMQMYYEPEAVGYHHHQIPESGLQKKMQNIAKSAVFFQKLHPEVKVIPTGFKALILKIVSSSFTLPLAKLFSKNFYYKLKSRNEFFKGIKDEKNGFQMSHI